MPPRPPLAETPPSPSPSPRSTRLTPPSSLFLAPSLSPTSIKVGLSLASPIAAVSPTTNTDSGGYFSFMRGALGSTLSSDRNGTGSSPIAVPRRRGSDSVSTTSSSSPPGAAGILAALSNGESPQKTKTTILQPPAYLATLSPQQSYRMSPDVKGSSGGAREHAATPSPPGSGGSSSISTPATASLAPPSVSSVSVTSASPTPSPQVAVRSSGKAPAAGPKISGSKSMPRLSTSVMRPVSVSFGTAGATTATASTATASTATVAEFMGDATASPSSLPRAQSAKARLSDMLAQRPRPASGTSGVDRREGASSSRSGSRSPSISSSTAVHAHAPVPPAAAATTRAAEPILTRSSVTTTQGAVEPTGSSNPSASKSTSLRRTDPTPALSSVHHTAMSSDRAQRATSPTSVSASYESDARYSTAAESAASTYRTPPDGSPRASTPTPRPSAPATAPRRKKRSTASIDDKAKTPVSAKNGTAERKAWAVPSTASDTERELELNDVDAAQSGPSTPTHVADDDGTDAAEAEIKRLQKATNAPDADDHYPKHAYIPPYEPRRRVRPVPAPAATSVPAPGGHSLSLSVSSPSSSVYSDDRAMTVSSGHPQRYAVTLVAALSSGTDTLPFARRRVELELLWDTAPPPSYWDYVPGARYVPQWRLRAAGTDSGRDDSQRSFPVRAVRALPVVGNFAAWL